jgi:hypothetical protein
LHPPSPDRASSKARQPRSGPIAIAARWLANLGACGDAFAERMAAARARIDEPKTKKASHFCEAFRYLAPEVGLEPTTP